MDSEIQDDIAIAAAQAPVINQLKVLDLSKGVLTDKGGEALRDSATIRNLQHLNLRHNFLSEDMMARLKALNMSINLDDNQKKDDEEYRFIEVAE